jgi:hypothetical protein
MFWESVGPGIPAFAKATARHAGTIGFPKRYPPAANRSREGTGGVGML